MDSLWQSDRHEPLVERAWDPDVARGAIGRIVVDTLAAASPAGEWPHHPGDFPGEAPPLGGLYFGAAGVIWALDYLARHGLGSGISAVEDLADLIAANSEDPARELMWGAPGTMLAARLMSEATGEVPWAALFRRGAAALKSAFHHDDGLGCHLWTQDLYGQSVSYIGAVHGLAGNAFVLQAGQDLLPAEDRTWWRPRLAQALRALAVVEDGLANWPATAAPDPPRLVQHCHGAPGMITSFAALEADIDDLLLAGGRLTWRAGPLVKGANLCHGTAGNGYAFLKLFERTGETVWLDRARAFAMHAIGQSETEAAGLGRRRYTLWTGDVGLAIYLLDCLEERARFPTLDVF